MNFRITGPAGTAATIMMKSTDTVGDLYDSVGTSFGLLETSFDLLFGYPPQLCSLDPDIPLEGAISPNERIKVQLGDLRGQQAEGKGQMTTSKKRGSKKKTASSSSPSLSSSASASSSSSGAAGSPFGARVMSLSGPISSSGGASKKRRAASSSRSRKRSNNTASGGGDDDAAGAGVATSEGDRYADLTDALLSATAGGASGQDKSLRDVFRKAVEHQYKSSQDVARLAATFAGQYKFEDCQQARVLQSGQCLKMRVQYPKNVGASVGDAAGRSIYTDTVDIVDVASMRAVMMLAIADTSPGGGREILKPPNLARCSPRLFWSLVRAFGPDISSGLQQLFPQVRQTLWQPITLSCVLWHRLCEGCAAMAD